jgi:hypothetical protein
MTQDAAAMSAPSAGSVEAILSLEQAAQIIQEQRAEIERLRLTKAERAAIVFIAHNNPKDGFVRRTWLEFKVALCGLLERHK